MRGRALKMLADRGRIGLPAPIDKHAVARSPRLLQEGVQMASILQGSVREVEGLSLVMFTKGDQHTF